MPEQYLSPADLAERYGVPVSSVYAWNHKGTGPRVHRFGRHVRYLESDVREWERSRAATDWAAGPVEAA